MFVKVKKLGHFDMVCLGCVSFSFPIFLFLFPSFNIIFFGPFSSLTPQLYFLYPHRCKILRNFVGPTKVLLSIFHHVFYITVMKVQNISRDMRFFRKSFGKGVNEDLPNILYDHEKTIESLKIGKLKKKPVKCTFQTNNSFKKYN